jgi:hypothetical protein
LTIKSTVNPNKITPRKNGETRHTLLSREPISIPIERVVAITNPQSTDLDALELYNKAAKSVHVNNDVINTRDRRYRSRTLEAHQIQSVDNQIYGCPSTLKQPTQHRSESHKHRSHRLSLRRSSEDIHDKQLQLTQNNDSQNGSKQIMLNETWFDIDKDHWTNLLENGWRPTIHAPGITLIAIADCGKNDFFFNLE